MSKREKYIPTAERIERLEELYTQGPLMRSTIRAIFTILWYAGLGEPIPMIQRSPASLRSKAMKDARDAVKESVDTLTIWKNLIRYTHLKPLQVDVSPEDLKKIQKADNNLFFVNHQGYEDIPRICQLLIETLGTQLDTYFVMKTGVPLPGFFKAGGGIALKRGTDIKAERVSGNVDDREHILRVEELPGFLGKFMEKPRRNIVVFSQGTRAKGNTEEEKIQKTFSFRKAVVLGMDQQINETPHANHVCIALDYRRESQVRATIKVLSEEEKKDREILGKSVNGFLQEVHDQI